MKQEGRNATDKQPRKERHPARFKIRPLPSDYIMNLALPKASRSISFMLTASGDSRALKVTFSGGMPMAEEALGRHIQSQGEDGKVKAQFIPNFGVYGAQTQYQLDTPEGDLKLMIRRSGNGDLTAWVKGNDIDKSSTRADKDRDYVLIHTHKEKTIGYTIRDFLDNVHQNFSHVLMQLEY
jgi:hypothetical protein